MTAQAHRETAQCLSSAAANPSNAEDRTDLIDPSRASAGAERWRRAIAACEGVDAGPSLDDPQRMLAMLRVFGSTRRLADLCLKYPGYAANALKDGPTQILAEAARDLSGLSHGIGGSDALHGALAPIKARADIAIGVAEIAGEWTTGEANAARTDLAERIVETALSWLMRGAVARGELVLPKDDLENAGMFALAGGDFAHEDLSPCGPADLLVVYDTTQLEQSSARMAERAFVRIGTELREALEGKPGEFPILSIRSPIGGGLNGQGLVETRARLTSTLDAPQLSLLKRWIAAARVVAGDRAAAGEFLEAAEEIVWREEPSLDADARKELVAPSDDPRAPLRAIATLLRWSLGRSRPVFRTASLRVVLETAAETGALPGDLAERLSAAAEFAQKTASRVHLIKGVATASVKAPDEQAALAALMGFEEYGAFKAAQDGMTADAVNALKRLLDGAKGELERYQSASGQPDDVDKLEDLGFYDGARVSSLIDGWAELCGKDDGRRFSSIAPGLLTAFGETQYPNEAARLFDKLIRAMGDEGDAVAAVASDPESSGAMTAAIGCFSAAVEPLTESRDGAAVLAHRNGAAVDGATPSTGVEFVNRFPLQRNADPAAVGSWRREAIARIAFFAAAGDASFDAAADMLGDVEQASLCALFAHALANAGGSCQMSLYAFDGAERGMPGSATPIGFVAEGGDAEACNAAARDFLDSAVGLGAGFFAFNPDVSRRPGGVAGPLAPTAKALRDFIQSEAIATDHLALARSRVIGGADGEASKTLRTAVSNPRRVDILLRDIDRLRAQRLRRDRSQSVWDLDGVEGGLADAELIISSLIYRHGGAQPALQTECVDDALGVMARSGILSQDVADTLKAARNFWRRLKTVRALACWSDPDRAPVRTRFAELIARAAEVDDYAAVKPMMRGYAEEVRRLYAQLVLGRPSIGLVAGG